MGFVFKPASRKQSKLRLALIGVSGSGKTWTALLLAKRLGKRIAVIDSEHGSASLYAGDVADFDVLELDSFSPRNYVQAIQAAESAGYDVVVIDSLSHAWSGKDGALEMVDKAAKRSQSGNSFMAWRDVTPEHNALVDAMIACKAHVIVTMRAKTVHELVEDNRGKKVPKKIGLAPIQRDGLDYEFTLVAEMDLEHNFMVSKSRCSELDGAVITRPDHQVADTLLRWLNTGAPAQERPAQRPLEHAPDSRTAPGADGRAAAGSARTTRTTSTASATRSPGAATDEYGIAMPTLGDCPRTRPDGSRWADKSWKDLPGPLLEKMMAENGHRMNELQVEWGTYLLARRTARKAKEAREAEARAAEAALAAAQDTSSEGGGWVAGDEAPDALEGLSNVDVPDGDGRESAA